jgi:hypothetical protein
MCDITKAKQKKTRPGGDGLLVCWKARNWCSLTGLYPRESSMTGLGFNSPAFRSSNDCNRAIVGPESTKCQVKSTGLSNCLSLTSAGIAASVTRKSPGAYALGKLENNVFYIHYVGRSDDDLAARLQQHVNKRYPHFQAAYYPTAKAAFGKECSLYHDFNPPDNNAHPATPKNSSSNCPLCPLRRY